MNIFESITPQLDDFDLTKLLEKLDSDLELVLLKIEVEEGAQ